MELKQLSYFQCVAKHENITKAAEELYISQSSLSQTIARLEKELGSQLFDREKGRIKLNNRGMRFLQSVDRIFLELNSVRNELTTLQEREDRHLSLASTGSKAFIPCIHSFYEAYPDAEIDFTFMTCEQIFESIRTMKLDFALVNENVGDDRIQILGQVRQPVCVLLHENHPLSKRPYLTLADLQNERLLINVRDFSREDVVDMFSGMGFQPKSIVTSSDSKMNDNLVRQGVGTQLITFQDALRTFTDPQLTPDRGDLTALPIMDKVYHTTYLVAPANQTPSSTATAFLEFVRYHFDVLKAANSSLCPL